MSNQKERDAVAKRVEVAERVEEFWDVLRRMPDRERDALRRAERGQGWPLILHTADEHAAWLPQPSCRPPPSAAQITRMEEVLDWLLALSKQDRKFFNAVWLFCALRKGPKEVAKILACHRETATVWRDNGLDRIVALREVNSPESKALRDSMMQGMYHPKRAFG
jgi:hypothetical protein